MTHETSRSLSLDQMYQMKTFAGALKLYSIQNVLIWMNLLVRNRQFSIFQHCFMVIHGYYLCNRGYDTIK